METLDRADVLRRGKNDPPSENRVWDFFAFSFSRTRSIWSKSPEPHRENRPTSTMIASGRTEGNVSEYIDSSGTDVAHYEYDPYGNVIASTGAKKNDFVYRFSTKYLDSETALYYYGYRFYKPETGRWLNRDPIGVLGGANSYAFSGNNGIGNYDSHGLFAWPVIPPILALLAWIIDSFGVGVWNSMQLADPDEVDTYTYDFCLEKECVTSEFWSQEYNEVDIKPTAVGPVVTIIMDVIDNTIERVYECCCECGELPEWTVGISQKTEDNGDEASGSLPFGGSWKTWDVIYYRTRSAPCVTN